MPINIYILASSFFAIGWWWNTLRTILTQRQRVDFTRTKDCYMGPLISRLNVRVPSSKRSKRPNESYNEIKQVTEIFLEIVYTLRISHFASHFIIISPLFEKKRLLSPFVFHLWLSYFQTLVETSYYPNEKWMKRNARVHMSSSFLRINITLTNV